MTATDTPVAPTTLRTATGGEAARWVARHCRQAPWLTASTVLTTVAGAALQVLPVLLLGQVVDGAVGGESRSILLTVGILMVAAAVLGAAATAASTFLIGKLGAELLSPAPRGSRTCRARHAQRPRRGGRPGDVLSRVGDDVAVISKGIRRPSPPCSRRASWSPSRRSACSASTGGSAWPEPAPCPRTHWHCAGACPLRALYRKQRTAQADRAQALISGLNGIDTVRAYRMEDAVRAKVTDESWRVRNLGIEVFRFFGRFVGRENRAEFIGLVLILVVGYALLEADAATLGEVSAAPLMFHRLFTPLGAIMFTFDEAQKSGASSHPPGRRLLGALRERLVGDASVATPPSRPAPVTVRDLTFTYPGPRTPCCGTCP